MTAPTPAMASVESAFAARVAEARAHADRWERHHAEAVEAGDVAYARTCNAILLNAQLAAVSVPYEEADEEEPCSECGRQFCRCDDGDDR